jgi:hypothetical protein
MLYIIIDVSEKPTALIFRVKQSTLLELPAPESEGTVLRHPKSAINFHHSTWSTHPRRLDSSVLNLCYHYF